jgi:biotin carboxyl carrier protein
VTTYHLRVDGEPVEVRVEDTPHGLEIAAHGRRHRVDLAEVVPGWYSLLLDGRSHTLEVATWRNVPGAGSRTFLIDGVAATVEVGRSPRSRTAGGSAAAGAAGQIRAPMPGLVVAIQTEQGAAVASGQPLLIMEAMKMQMEIRAPQAGVVRQVHVAPGQDVAGSDLLVTVE